MSTSSPSGAARSARRTAGSGVRGRKRSRSTPLWMTVNFSAGTPTATSESLLASDTAKMRVARRKPILQSSGYRPQKVSCQWITSRAPVTAERVTPIRTSRGVVAVWMIRIRWARILSERSAMSRIRERLRISARRRSASEDARSDTPSRRLQMVTSGLRSHAASVSQSAGVTTKTRNREGSR